MWGGVVSSPMPLAHKKNTLSGGFVLTGVGGPGAFSFEGHVDPGVSYTRPTFWGENPAKSGLNPRSIHQGLINPGLTLPGFFGAVSQDNPNRHRFGASRSLFWDLRYLRR